MAIRVALHHQTTYRYAHPVALGPQTVRLRPAPHNRTPIHHYSLEVAPSEHFINWQQDPHGNYLARLVFPKPTTLLRVDVDLVADLEAYSPFDFFLDPDASDYPFRYSEGLGEELRPYLECERPTPLLAKFIERIDKTKRNTVDFLVDVNRAVHQQVEYIIRMEPGVQTPEETLERGRGSCRDSAWLMVQTLRHLGLAARFVSGYLIQLVADQKPVDGPAGPTSDFTDLHAWCEVFIAGAGWVGLDPTSGLFAAEGHIPLACSPKPGSAAPIEGLLEEVETEFSFDMSVVRVVDRPRVTKPYSEEQWEAILELGDRVDRQLHEQDVRLSSGGEPTFVSSEVPDAPEWNTSALGGTKEAMGDRLMRRLWPMWAEGGLLHHGQGKWYPGEQLPRWAISCYSRTDGVALWKEPALLARNDIEYGHTNQDAEAFARRLIHNLSLERHGLMPAYEDVWYYLWREKRLPSNVVPLDSRLDDPVERERLTKVFTQGLEQVVGWVLPLSYQDRWQSGDWFLRAQTCLLLPGDSPMGFRLPLDSLPWTSSVDIDVEEPDPSVAHLPLTPQFAFPLKRPAPSSAAPTLQHRVARNVDGERLRAHADEIGKTPADSSGTASGTVADPFVPPEYPESAAGIVRTALCVEPRGGCLRVFLPPLTTLDAFVELIAAIEFTAHELQLPVQLEGYHPPKDERLREFKVTPDPGVIEVNVPPTTTWRQAVEQTCGLYEAAYQEKLVAEKFELDGAHIGSGGGNHVVLGGLTPNDSPFLRRPHVLGSLLRFWLNHPSLSYLFSGRFIGPTSQAPRIDEARSDSVYELELALQQLPKGEQQVPPWLVDRVLRHILVDATGNTHRTEICIDKLFSPDGPTGRLGLIEMRAFEMPPHARMSCAQQLLVRALLASFWSAPYEAEVVKWGTALRDQFMLPFYVMQDLEGVLQELRQRGYDFDPAWFAPHYEFRFPVFGEIRLDTVRLEVRGALEPWPVLGEEAAPGGQTRYVDSSIERLQVRVEGMLEERYKVVCNGYEVPVRPTATNGQFVGGIRYRAWQPPSCLHPNIGVDGPLRIDVYDTWSERSLAGCTYHVVHPGGRASEVRPVNAVAAESRRLARFERRGHQSGTYSPRRVPPHPHFPHTLDLRWAHVTGADRG